MAERKQKKEFDPRQAVYTPIEVVNLGLEAIERVEKAKGRAVRFPIDDIGEYFAPLRAGEICAVMAQTSNYKSGFMHFWERTLAEQLIKEGRLDECIIHVSVEECVEEQAYLYLSRETGVDAGQLARGEVQDWSLLKNASLRIGSIPIYRIGDSLARAEDMPDLYLSNLVRSVMALTKGEVTGNPVKPAAIFWDYLQAFPFDPEVKQNPLSEQRRLQVRQDVFRLRHGSALFDCPFVVGVQAKQELKGSNGKILLPGVYDGEETSAIAQHFDRILTMWMPKQTNSMGENIDYKTISFVVEENQLFLKVAKQRGGYPAGRSWMCRIDFQKNLITVDPVWGKKPAQQQGGPSYPYMSRFNPGVGDDNE